MSHNVSILATSLNPIFEAYNIVLGGPQNRLRPPQLQLMVTSYGGSGRHSSKLSLPPVEYKPVKDLPMLDRCMECGEHFAFCCCSNV